MSGKKKVGNRSVFLRGLTPANHMWLKKTAKLNGNTLSGFTNRVIEKAKTQKW